METNKNEKPQGVPDFEPLFQQISTSMASLKPSLEKIQAEIQNAAPVSSRRVLINGVTCVATLMKNGNIILEAKENGPLLFDSFYLK